MCLLPDASTRPQIRPGPSRGSSGGRGIKRDSAYRLGSVVVEYRWHPLYGKRLPLYRQTVHGGREVVHIETNRTVSRELPSWMVDASVCRGMELGSPQVSIASLVELRVVLRNAPNTGSRSSGFVSSLNEESGSGEATTKTIVPAVNAAAGTRNNDSTRRQGAGGDDRSPRRFIAGGTRRAAQRTTGRRRTP